MNYKESVLDSQKELIILKKEEDSILTRAKYGPHSEINIPLKLNEELSFLTAAIIGDGHLSKIKSRVTIELSNYQLIKYIQRICFNLFKKEFPMSKERIRDGRKNSWKIDINSKSIYALLNKALEIPIGKKSHIVRVPKIIKEANNQLKFAFLAGIMMTEGGKRNRGYGLSTASKQLQEDLVSLFEGLDIRVKKDKWMHKKYKKEYYGIYFRKEYFFSLMREYQSGQMDAA